MAVNTTEQLAQDHVVTHCPPTGHAALDQSAANHRTTGQTQSDQAAGGGDVSTDDGATPVEQRQEEAAEEHVKGEAGPVIQPVRTEVRDGNRILFDVDLVPQLRRRALDQWCAKVLPADCQPQVRAAALAAWRRHVAMSLLTRYGLEWLPNVGVVVTTGSWNFAQVVDVLTRAVRETPVVIPKKPAVISKASTASAKAADARELSAMGANKSTRTSSKRRRRKRK